MSVNFEMDRLPTEIVLMILPHVGGAAFIALRRTCKRFKDIADHLEISSRPSLWRRYVLSDYPLSCVESVAPWLYTQDNNDAFLWKTLYVAMGRISSLKGSPLKFTHLRFYAEDVHLAKDVKFIGNYLFLIEKTEAVKLVGLSKNYWEWPGASCAQDVFSNIFCLKNLLPSAGLVSEKGAPFTLLNKGSFSPPELAIQGSLRNVRWLDVDWTLSTIPYMPFDFGNYDTYISTWTNKIICYQHVPVLGSNVISVTNDAIHGDYSSFHIKFDVSAFKSLTFNEKRFVAVCEKKKILLSPNIALQRYQIFTFTLKSEPVKVKMMEDLVIVLFENGLVETAEVVKARNGWQSFTEWQVLFEQQSSRIRAITDFDVKGQLFSAVRGNGKIYFSHFETIDHNSLARNLRLSYKIQETNDRSCMTRISMDVSDGLKLAVLEKIGSPHTTKLHVLYVERHKSSNTTSSPT